MPSGCSRGQIAPAAAPSVQPLTEQLHRMQATLAALGQPLDGKDIASLQAALAMPDHAAALQAVDAALAKYTLATVNINAESQVTAQPGSAAPNLVQDAPGVFLVKVRNLAGIRSALIVSSPNGGAVYIPSTGNPEPPERLTNADVNERWMDAALFTDPPMSSRLSGIPVEYVILTISGRDAGERTGVLNFALDERPQDAAHPSGIPVVFHIASATLVRLHVHDSDGSPTTASLLIQDAVGHIYPSQIKRLAPDFYFQPQIYRTDGDTLSLPPGDYTLTTTGGPEYLSESRSIHIPSAATTDLDVRLKRWIDPAQHGWFSGDDHIHPAGCSHYENPTQGVEPSAMEKQVQGEHLNIGAVLVWGPCFYYQKQYFRGQSDNPVSTPSSLLHYDLEISGFPSSHAGHLVLLNLKNIQYPETQRIEQWPTWDMPILTWAKSQGAVVGFAHSGFGLQVRTNRLPNYDVPPFDGIGANEYIVDVTQPGKVDFISEGNTPSVWELNIWYHTLNVGFRTRISGETDFPCVYDSRVGEGRTYARVKRPLTFSNYVQAVRDGGAYVSDGRSHLMNFSANGVEVGMGNSEVDLSAPGTVKVRVDAAAMLPMTPNPAIHDLPYNERPYWHLERARIGTSRKVPVELIVNGEPVERKEMTADGSIQALQFDTPIKKSSWIALRILPSSHTDPIFVLVGGKPIRASHRSAIWCLKGVDAAWKQKAPRISAQEMPAARQAYDHAREVYRELAMESSDD